MALTVANRPALVLRSTPDLVTEATVTITGDGATLAVNGSTPHGGPDGAVPSDIDVRITVDSATGGETPVVIITGTDTTNDEVDWTLNTTGAIPVGETVKFQLRCVFADLGPQDGSTITVS